MPLESRDFESEISQHPCYKLQTRHEDIQGFKHLMPSRYFDANSNYVWKPETVEGLKILGGTISNIKSFDGTVSNSKSDTICGGNCPPCPPSSVGPVNYVWQLDPRFHSVVTGLTCFTEYVLTHTFNNFCLEVS